MGNDECLPTRLLCQHKLMELVMCDYSLEVYQSRPARHGEEYISNRCPSGSVGFVSPGDQSTAICVACDSELKLSRIPPSVQSMSDVGDTEIVTFTQVDGPTHRDSVRFRNGNVVTLQKLGPGVTAWLLPETRTLLTPVQEKPEAALV